MNKKSSNLFGSNFDALNNALFGEDDSYKFDEIGKCIGCGTDPTAVGPCSLCRSCDNAARAKNGSPLLN